MKDVTDGRTAVDIRTGRRGRAIVTGGGGTAARTLGLLGGIFTFAIKRKKLRRDNPVHGVGRQKAKKRSRFLSGAELARLGNALDRARTEGLNPNAIAAIKLLILTGCRRSEILSLKWSYIDWDNRCIRLPDSKTGQKVIYISTKALGALHDLMGLATGPYVLPGARSQGHFYGLHKAWSTVRIWAGIPDVRIHDLRRSFASVAAINGESLLMIGKLLGHADPKTTQIYAHLTDTALHMAADSTAERIAAAMAKKNA